MLKLLIADASSVACGQYTQVFTDTFQVYTCHNGVEAAQKICQLRPDIVIMDLMLPGKDGITVLQECFRAGVKPLVLATSYIINQYIQEHMELLNVEYLMRKPCDLGAVVSCVGDFAQLLTRSEDEISSNDLTGQLLMSMNFSTKLCGYRCLHSALLIMQRDVTQPLTKELYPAVAAIHGGTAQRVERAIRNTIRSAWMRRDEGIWKLYFPAGKDGTVPCPTNGEFLSKLCYCLKKAKEKAV